MSGILDRHESDLCWDGFRYASNLLRFTKAVAEEFHRLTSQPGEAGGAREGELIARARKAATYIEYEEHEFDRLADAVKRTDPWELPFGFYVVNLEHRFKEVQDWLYSLLIGSRVNGDDFITWLSNCDDPSGFLAGFQEYVDGWSRIEPVASRLLDAAMYVDEVPKKTRFVLDIPKSLEVPEAEELQARITDRREGSRFDVEATDAVRK